MGRPFGCGVLLASKDQLIYCDPAGNAIQYKAKAVGSGAITAMEELESQYVDNMTEQEGCQMAVTIMKSVIEGNIDNIQVAVLDQNGLRNLTKEQINAFAQ